MNSPLLILSSRPHSATGAAPSGAAVDGAHAAGLTGRAGHAGRCARSRLSRIRGLSVLPTVSLWERAAPLPAFRGEGL